MRDGAGQLACLQGPGDGCGASQKGCVVFQKERRCGQREQGRAAAETSGGSWRVLLELKKDGETGWSVWGKSGRGTQS